VVAVSDAAASPAVRPACRASTPACLAFSTAARARNSARTAAYLSFHSEVGTHFWTLRGSSSASIWLLRMCEGPPAKKWPQKRHGRVDILGTLSLISCGVCNGLHVHSSAPTAFSVSMG